MNFSTKALLSSSLACLYALSFSTSAFADTKRDIAGLKTRVKTLQNSANSLRAADQAMNQNLTIQGNSISSILSNVQRLQSDVATAKAATGAQGPQGPMGPQGPAGPQGEQGVAGAAADLRVAPATLTLIKRKRTFADPRVGTVSVVDGVIKYDEDFPSNGAFEDYWPSPAGGRIPLDQATEWRNDTGLPVVVNGYVPVRCASSIGAWAVVRDTNNPSSPARYDSLMPITDRSMEFKNYTGNPADGIYAYRASSILPSQSYSKMKSESAPVMPWHYLTYSTFLNPGESLQFEIWNGTLEGCRAELACTSTEAYRHGVCKNVSVNAKVVTDVKSLSH